MTTSPPPGTYPDSAHWTERPTLVALERTRRRNVRGKGTVTRYRAVTDDGIQREVIHAQSLAGSRPRTRSVDLTIGTAAPLSFGADGLMMHFALKSMDRGVDVVVFGPERGDRDRDFGLDETRAVAESTSFPRTARASHLIADRLSRETGADLGHMLWSGISLGAMKGIHFAAFAPEYGRTLVYGQFVVPVAPRPMAAPTSSELRRFMVGEMAAMARFTSELVAKDLRDRTVRVHRNIARLAGPGLSLHYLRSTPTDREFRIFTEAWRRNVVSGDAGTAARMLPEDRLVTFELFDGDEAGRPDDWRSVLGDRSSSASVKILTVRGRHTDALRLNHQRRRARTMWRVIDAVDRGVSVERLEHPVADPGLET